MKTLLLSLTTCIALYSLASFTFTKNKQAEVYKTKEKILTENVWRVEEVKSNFSKQNLHYLNGKENTTGVDYSVFRLTFNNDGSGTYTDSDGYLHNTSWKFTSKDKHNMSFKIENGVTYEWSMVEISENSFQSITELNVNGQDLLQSTRYVPISKRIVSNPKTNEKNRIYLKK